MSGFIFNSHDKARGVHRADVPAGIDSKAALLDMLCSVLRFPSYFGRNWDALDECLRDLSWLPEGDIVLSHEDLPLSRDRTSLSIYLSILKDAIEQWDTTGKRKLLVVFPSDTENIVKSALAIV